VSAASLFGGSTTLVTTQRYLNTNGLSVGTAMKKAMGW